MKKYLKKDLFTIYMEFRKVQKTGGSTYIISLPKDWIIKNNIVEGDILQLKILEDNSIIISKGGSEEKETNVASLLIKNEEESLILRKLIGLYLSGFNTIEIRSQNNLDERIKNAVKEFRYLILGVEIIEEGNNFIILQDLLKFSDLPMEKMLQRLYNMTENMLLDIKDLFLNFDKNFAKDIVERDVQLDRTFWLISKQFYLALKNPSILKDLNINITKAFNIRSIAKLLERISDHVVNISDIMLKYKLTNVTYIVPFFDQVIEIFRRSYESYKTLDEEIANDVIESAYSFSDRVRNIIGEIDSKNNSDTAAIVSIIESLIRIAMYSSDLAEISIDEKMANL